MMLTTIIAVVSACFSVAAAVQGAMRQALLCMAKQA